MISNAPICYLYVLYTKLYSIVCLKTKNQENLGASMCRIKCFFEGIQDLAPGLLVLLGIDFKRSKLELCLCIYNNKCKSLLFVMILILHSAQSSSLVNPASFPKQT